MPENPTALRSTFYTRLLLLLLYTVHLLVGGLEVQREVAGLSLLGGGTLSFLPVSPGEERAEEEGWRRRRCASC